MKKSRFSEEQIIGILAEQESGMKVSEVCRKHGMSDATFYKWKSKFGGMTVSEAKRLKGYNRRLHHPRNRISLSWPSHRLERSIPPRIPY